MDADAAERVFGLDRKFHQLGLPDKLKHISEEHNITLEKKLASHIRSINCARNCFVHRGGLVSEVDYNIETEMRVTWYRLHVYIKKGEAESTLIDGAERGGDVFVRREEAMKSFVVGQTLQFSEQDFIDVCWTLNLFGEDLLKSLKECGVKRGAYPE